MSQGLPSAAGPSTSFTPEPVDVATSSDQDSQRDTSTALERIFASSGRRLKLNVHPDGSWTRLADVEAEKTDVAEAVAHLRASISKRNQSAKSLARSKSRTPNSSTTKKRSSISRTLDPSTAKKTRRQLNSFARKKREMEAAREKYAQEHKRLQLRVNQQLEALKKIPLPDPGSYGGRQDHSEPPAFHDEWFEEMKAILGQEALDKARIGLQPLLEDVGRKVREARREEELRRERQREIDDPDGLGWFRRQTSEHTRAIARGELTEENWTKFLVGEIQALEDKHQKSYEILENPFLDWAEAYKAAKGTVGEGLEEAKLTGKDVRREEGVIAMYEKEIAKLEEDGAAYAAIVRAAWSPHSDNGEENLLASSAPTGSFVPNLCPIPLLSLPAPTERTVATEVDDPSENPAARLLGRLSSLPFQDFPEDGVQMLIRESNAALSAINLLNLRLAISDNENLGDGTALNIVNLGLLPKNPAQERLESFLSSLTGSINADEHTSVGASDDAGADVDASDEIRPEDATDWTPDLESFPCPKLSDVKEVSRMRQKMLAMIRKAGLEPPNMDFDD